MRAIITIEIDEPGLDLETKRKSLVDLMFNECHDWVNLEKPPRILFIHDDNDKDVDEDIDGLLKQ